MVLEAGVFRTFEATLEDVATFYCAKRTAEAEVLSLTLSDTAKSCLFFPFV